MLLLGWALVLSFFALCVRSSNAGDDIWVISPKSLHPELSNYISFLKTNDDLSPNVLVFDESDKHIPQIFPESTSYTKLEGLFPGMVSKIIIAGATSIPSSWTIQELVHFVGIGGQVLFALSDTKFGSVEYKEFLSQFGISTTKFPILSRNYTTKQWYPELVEPVFERTVDRPILYPNQTLGLKLDSNRSLSYLWSLIAPEPSSVILNPVKTAPESSASSVSLIALFQSRKNGRLCAFPSVRFILNDYFFKSDDYFNYEAIEGCTRWTFMKRGIIKMPTILTYSENEKFTSEVPEEKSFRILDTMKIFATMTKYSDTEGVWKPFYPNDLQFEYIIMKPYIRKTLLPYDRSANNDIPESLQSAIASIPPTEAILFEDSIIPKRTGISTFRFWYLRKGYTLIDESKSIIIRHHAHNEEYVKFLGGYPYYASMFSCLLAIVLFTFLFLLYKNVDTQSDQKDSQTGEFSQTKKLKSS